MLHGYSNSNSDTSYLKVLQKIILKQFFSNPTEIYSTWKSLKRYVIFCRITYYDNKKATLKEVLLEIGFIEEMRTTVLKVTKSVPNLVPQFLLSAKTDLIRLTT